MKNDNDENSLWNKIYPAEKELDEKKINPYMYYVLRPLSFRITLLMHAHGIAANTCTAISAVALILGVLSFLVLGLFSYAWAGLIVGSLFVNLYYFLDVIDGNLARLSDTSSKLGSFLDESLNSLAGVLVPVALGLSLFWFSGDYGEEGNLVVAPYLWIVMGFSIAVLRLFRRVLTNHVSLLRGTMGDRSNVLGQNPGAIRYMATIFNSASFPLLLVFALFNFVELWVILYFFFNFFVFLFTFAWGSKKLLLE